MTLVQFTLLQILLLPFFKNVNDIKLMYHTLAMVLLAIWSRVEINILQELSIFKKNLCIPFEFFSAVLFRISLLGIQLPI